jgi:murein DD-endopeptidase MepM/ murein hydrolase activator NlpD
MKIPWGKEICLWVVSPHNGKVRKFRSSAGSLWAAGVFVFASFVLFALVATDHGRLQLLRVRDSLSYNRLKATVTTITQENENLSTQALLLREKLSELEERLREQTETSLDAQKYEEALRDKLRELRIIVRSATSLGVAPHQEKTVEIQDNTEGVGGAEVRCDSSASCLRSGSLDADAEFAEAVGGSGTSEAEIIRALDHYISILRHAPLGMPARGRLSSRYGFRVSPFGSGVRLHEGIDIVVPYGAAITATGEGVVSSIRRDATYGLLVDIKHQGGLTTRYAHLSRATVYRGEVVKRGQIIGRAGSSGRSTGPHLHYEILVRGRAKDPLKFIKLARDLDKVLTRPLQVVAKAS